MGALLRSARGRRGAARGGPRELVMRLLFTALQVVFQLAGKGQKRVDVYADDCRRTL
eukprot:COSAG02_NODE_8958_length_2382_cov_11.174332_2_plen_57_part_00